MSTQRRNVSAIFNMKHWNLYCKFVVNTCLIWIVMTEILQYKSWKGEICHKKVIDTNLKLHLGKDLERWLCFWWERQYFKCYNSSSKKDFLAAHTIPSIICMKIKNIEQEILYQIQLHLSYDYFICFDAFHYFFLLSGNYLEFLQIVRT